MHRLSVLSETSPRTPDALLDTSTYRALLLLKLPVFKLREDFLLTLLGKGSFCCLAWPGPCCDAALAGFVMPRAGRTEASPALFLWRVRSRI